MTDEHGPDSEPMHEDASHEEHVTQPAESTETWSDDHPPVDDFSDAGAASDETATVSEEVSEEEATSAPPVPSARSMLPLFAGIGGILLIGAVIYWTFGHSSPPPPMMVTQTPKSASSLPPSSKQAPILPPESKVGESDITALYKAPPEPALAPIPVPSSGTSPTTSLAMPPEATAPSAPLAPAMPPAALPVNRVYPPLSAVSSAPYPTYAAPSMAAPPSPATDARIDSLAASVSMLEKSVQATTQEVNKLNTMMAANQAMPPVASQSNPALEDRLNKIEQDLMQIEHHEAAKAAAPAPAVAAPAEEAEATSEVVTRPVSHHKKPAKHKPVHKKTVHHAAPLKVTSEPVMESARIDSSWVLRAATPGEAWVASDAHTAELKHVQIGDTLPGIGTVRAIRQTPGGWEIDGSTGIIR